MSSSMSNLHTSKVGRLWESERTSILQRDGPEKGYLPLSCILYFNFTLDKASMVYLDYTFTKMNVHDSIFILLEFS